MRAAILIVPFLAFVLTVGHASAQQLKSIPRPPSGAANTVQQAGDADGAAAQPSASKPKLSVGTSQEQPIGPAGDQTARKQPRGVRLDCGSVTCIDRVRVDPSGTEVGFEVITTQPARLFVEVGLMKPVNHQFSRVERAIITVPYLIKSPTRITGLNPDQTYHYVVKAKGKDGLEQYAEGVFSTSGRQVDLVIESIHVSDDGDAGSLDPGEFVFLFDSMGQQYALRTQLSDGDNKSLNKTIRLANVPSSLRLEMDVNEYDIIHGGVKPNPGTGEHYTGVFNVETPELQETRNFSLNAANGDYSLVVTGKLHISNE